MENNRSFGDIFLEKGMKVVYKVLQKEKLLQSEFHFGKVDSVISSSQIKCFIDGSSTSVTVPCNPDVTFNVGDSVIVIFINNDPKNKYCLSRIVYQ